MKRRVFLAAFLCVSRAVAHHSFAAEFDGQKQVTLKGTVVKWEMINPHGWITMDVPGPDGKTLQWMVETSNPNGLMRLGWTKAFPEAGRRDHRGGVSRQGRVEHGKRRANYSGGWPPGICGFFRHSPGNNGHVTQRKVRLW